MVEDDMQLEDFDDGRLDFNETMMNESGPTIRRQRTSDGRRLSTLPGARTNPGMRYFFLRNRDFVK